MTENSPHRDCIFCGIAAGRLPASIVYEDTNWLAVMDIHPIRQGHALLIPRQHVGRLSELEPSERQRLFTLAHALICAQEDAGFAAGGSNLLLNDGVAANQHIPHLHLHCIPRKAGDTAGFGMRLLARTFGLFGRATGRGDLDGIATLLSEKVSSERNGR